MGLVEVGVGLIPGAGGCKEMVRRIVSPEMKKTPGADPLPYVQEALMTIGAAKVSTSGEEARSLRFLTDSDRVVMNRDHLLHEAKQEVLALAAAGYAAPVNGDNCFAAGRDVRAGLKAAIYVMQQGGYMTEYDAFLSGKLAEVLCGGDVTSPQWISEQSLLDLERAIFVELLGQQKTIDRIQHMLKTGKPLRN
jgi:3-hydroxyacyl-CoA dehydrogenase